MVPRLLSIRTVAWEVPAVKVPVALAVLVCTSAVAVALWSCAGRPDASVPTAPTTANAVFITIVNSHGHRGYNPNPVMANVGDLITWKNTDDSRHHIVMDDGSADLGELAPGASTHPMQLKGQGGNYHCIIHPTMIGSINGDSAPCEDPGYCD
jgi:plastocyanin